MEENAKWIFVSPETLLLLSWVAAPITVIVALAAASTVEPAQVPILNHLPGSLPTVSAPPVVTRVNLVPPSAKIRNLSPIEAEESKLLISDRLNIDINT